MSEAEDTTKQAIQKELETFLGSSAFKSNSTISTYKNSHKRLTNFLKKPIHQSSEEEIIKAIYELSNNPNTRTTLLSGGLVFYNLANKSKEHLLKEKIRLLDDIKKHQSKKASEKKNDLPSVEDLNKKINELFVSGDYQGAIMLWLMVNFNTRNQDVNLRIVNTIHETKREKKDNYLVRRKNDFVYIRRNYKTFKSFGEKRNIFRNNMISRAVSSYVKNYPEGGDGNIYLIQKKGKRLTDGAIANFVKQKTPNNITESDINKIQVTNIKNIADYDLLKKMAENRGTDINNIITYYNLDYNSMLNK